MKNILDAFFYFQLTKKEDRVKPQKKEKEENHESRILKRNSQ